MHVLIGVDPSAQPHRRRLLDQRGELLAQQRFPASREGHRALRRFTKRWPQRRWAIEGAAGVGRVLAQQLVADGEQVIDVPAKLAARVRELSTGHGRKHDPGDAVSIALAALGSQRLHQVAVEDHATVLRLLSDRRDDLVATRTQALNRLHRLLAELVPAGADRNLTAETAAALLRRLRPTSPTAKARQLAVDLVRDVRTLDHRITTVQQRIQAAVKHSKTTLVELVGIGPLLAAKFLGEVGDIGVPHQGAFRRPQRHRPDRGLQRPVVRHRLSRAGNRRLNHALYLMAIVQLRHPTAGQAYSPAQDRRRQVTQGSAAVSETAAVRCRVPLHGRRPATVKTRQQRPDRTPPP